MSMRYSMLFPCMYAKHMYGNDNKPEHETLQTFFATNHLEGYSCSDYMDII